MLAPDLKGFGDSDKPSDPKLYSMPYLLKDVNGILDQLDIHKVHCVIGHDWGSAVAWQLAGRFPKRFERLIALSVGHNACMFSLGGTRQREKSWYMLFFKVSSGKCHGMQYQEACACMHVLYPTHVTLSAKRHILFSAVCWYL